MLTDLKGYQYRIGLLEAINIGICSIIIIITTIITLIITKNFYYAIIAFLISGIISFILYSINQIKLDNLKLQIDIYLALIDKEK